MKGHAIIYVTQICSGSVSFLSSSLIAIGIMKSGGLNSPYRRIIFGISVSDMMQSASIIIGPFVVPSATPKSIAPWAIGNSHSCRAQGSYLIFAYGATPMYFLGLCLYTTLKIKCNISNESFSQRIEKPMHIAIIFLNLSVCVFGLVTKGINSIAVGTFCWFAAFPTGCRQNPSVYGECDTNTAAWYIYYNPIFGGYVFGLPAVCLIGILCCMGTVCWHNMKSTRRSALWGREITLSSLRRPNIYQRPRESDERHSEFQLNSLSPERNMSANDEYDINLADAGHTNAGLAYFNAVQAAFVPQQEISMASSNIPRITHFEDESEPNQHHSRNLVSLPSLPTRHSEHFTRQYRRELVTQAFCFVVAFLLPHTFYFASWIFLTIKQTHSTVVYGTSHFFYPLGGFFNMLAYSRPKIRSLRMRNPSYSWLRAFWHVMKSGGDANALPMSTSAKQCVVPPRESPLIQSVAFRALNEPSVDRGSSLPVTGFQASNAALNNNSQSFHSTDNAGYRIERSWKYVVSERIADEEERDYGYCARVDMRGGTDWRKNVIGSTLDKVVAKALERL